MPHIHVDVGIVALAKDSTTRAFGVTTSCLSPVQMEESITVVTVDTWLLSPIQARKEYTKTRIGQTAP